MKTIKFFAILAFFSIVGCEYINWGKTKTIKKLKRSECMKRCDSILHRKRVKDVCVNCCGKLSDDLNRCRPKGLVAFPQYFSKWDFRKKVYGNKRPWYIPKYDQTKKSV